MKTKNLKKNEAVTYKYKKLNIFLILTALILFSSCVNSCSDADPVNDDDDDDIIYHPGEGNPQVDHTKYTVFNAGDNDVNSYRIPSILTTNDGSVLVFCEARKESWVDKSRTDIVLKRSVDKGKKWSSMNYLTKGKSGAYMDPTPILDKESGKVFLFTTFWPTHDHSTKSNRLFLVTSEDNGANWSEPKDVTDQLIPSGYHINGFGPSTGVQMEGGKYKGRMILPARIMNTTTNRVRNHALYSDDGGDNWIMGEEGDTGGEIQIAEAPSGTLVSNVRASGARRVAFSDDGGESWSSSEVDGALSAPSGGCQGSVLGMNNTLYYSGPQGIPSTQYYDDRGKLILYRSLNGGKTWKDKIELYNKAAGYSGLTFINDELLGIIFETADTQSFTKQSISGSKPPKRPAGWMRLDIIILPIDEI